LEEEAAKRLIMLIINVSATIINAAKLLKTFLLKSSRRNRNFGNEIKVVLSLEPKLALTLIAKKNERESRAELILSALVITV
jgi:hypothetical protein